MKRYYGIRDRSRRDLSPLLSQTPPADIRPLSEAPPEDPIHEIFTRNLGIFAALFPSDRASEISWGPFLSNRG